MENFLRNNVGYFIIHSLIITTLVIMVTIQSDRAETIWQGPDFSRNILVNNSLRLWAIWAAIMVSGIVSGVLIYFQIWRPYKEKENNQVIIS